jgi:hypothetical protein
MVIIIESPVLFTICLALSLPYIWIGLRALVARAPRTPPSNHGLRRID